MRHNVFFCKCDPDPPGRPRARPAEIGTINGAAPHRPLSCKESPGAPVRTPRAGSHRGQPPRGPATPACHRRAGSAREPASVCSGAGEATRVGRARRAGAMDRHPGRLLGLRPRASPGGGPRVAPVRPRAHGTAPHGDGRAVASATRGTAIPGAGITRPSPVCPRAQPTLRRTVGTHCPCADRECVARGGAPMGCTARHGRHGTTGTGRIQKCGRCLPSPPPRVPRTGAPVGRRRMQLRGE